MEAVLDMKQSTLVLQTQYLKCQIEYRNLSS